MAYFLDIFTSVNEGYYYDDYFNCNIECDTILFVMSCNIQLGLLFEDNNQRNVKLEALLDRFIQIQFPDISIEMKQLIVDNYIKILYFTL